MKTKVSFWLGIYAVFITIIAATSLMAAAGPRSVIYDEITVHRINIVEPDGTLRTVFSNKDKFPGTYVKGVEKPRHDRPTGGFIFLDDEGSEIGGMVFGGETTAEGAPRSYGHLSFDQLNATQVFAVSAWEEDGMRASRMYFSDWRDRPGETGQTRMVLGKTNDKAVGVSIKDSEGRDRIILRVTPENEPELVFLNEDGSATGRYP